MNFSAPKEYGPVCYVVGSGPSLKLEDLAKIGNNFSISSNRIYHVFSTTDWRPQIYIVQDEACLKVQLSDKNFTALLGSKLQFVFPPFAFAIKKIRKSTAKFYRFVDSDGGRAFQLASNDQVFFDGRTVTLTALEIARLMGFKEIRLLGVDNSYNFTDRPQYFSPKITNDGINQPNVQEVSKNFDLLVDEYRKIGIKIENCSSESPLVID